MARRRPLAGVLLALVASAGGCAGLVQYTDELRDESTGRTLLVRTPATVGGIVGFVVGLPVSAVAVPVTYGVYAYQRSATPLRADPVSTLLFPSFVLWRAGALLGAPFDLVEWLGYRAWQGERTPLPEEIEADERRHDEEVLQSYPVRAIYPTDTDRDAAMRAGQPGNGSG